MYTYRHSWWRLEEVILLNNKLQNNNIILLNLIKARSKMSKLVSYISCFHFVFIYFFILKKKNFIKVRKFYTKNVDLYILKNTFQNFKI